MKSIIKYIKEGLPFFAMGAILVALYLLCTSCSVTRPVNKGNMHEYHVELQKYYEHQLHK